MERASHSPSNTKQRRHHIPDQAAVGMCSSQRRVAITKGVHLPVGASGRTLCDELERSQEGGKQQAAQAAEQQHFGARTEAEPFKVPRKLLEGKFLEASCI